ncbi:MAG: hypothetical protein AB1515_10520, partial [Nitrospirota bacterium]
MKSKLFAVIVVVAGLVAVAGYLGERGIRIEKVRPGATTALPEDRQPGDQRAREMETASLQQAEPTEQQKGGKSRNRDKQAARGGTRGHNLVVSNTPIPLLVNGQQKGALSGRNLQNSVNEVTIVTSTGPRTGWALDDFLRSQGLETGKQIVFTDKNGDNQSVDWSQVSDAETRLIITYTQGGGALVVS